VIETPLAETLARGGGERRVVEGVAMHVPAHWDSSARLAQFTHGQRSEAVVVEPDGLVELTAVVEPRVAPVKQLELWNDEQRKRIEQELGKAQPASDPLIELPAGWNGSELVLILPEDPMGYCERWRVVVCVRAFGDRAVFAAIYVPETIAAAAPGFVAQLLASLGPA
jgi:hypothetical protein